MPCVKSGVLRPQKSEELYPASVNSQLDPFVTLAGVAGLGGTSSCSWSGPGCFLMCILIVCISMERAKSIYPISREWWQRFMWKLNVPGFCPRENALTKYFCSASLSLAHCQLLYRELC